MSKGIVEFRAVSILDMKNGEVTKVEIEGMDGEFVKAGDVYSDVKITIDGKELAEVFASKAAEESELKVGDYAKFTEDEFEHRKGEIVKIVEIDDDDLHLPCKLEELDGTSHGYASKAVLVKATPVDVITSHRATWTS